MKITIQVKRPRPGETKVSVENPAMGTDNGLAFTNLIGDLCAYLPLPEMKVEMELEDLVLFEKACKSAREGGCAAPLAGAITKYMKTITNE
jgi:hypothetical protein